MDSYEDKIKDDFENKNGPPEKIKLSMIKYFWQAGPLASARKDYIPKFMRKINVLKNFNDNELRILTKYLHLRTFNNQEKVFKQGDIGIGFYLIYSGHVDVISESEHTDQRNGPVKILSLEKHDYFGELALLQENSIRTATVVSKGICSLLGLFRPDVEELTEDYPVVATKLLNSISTIIANRLYSATREISRLKYKISQLEKINESK